MIDLDAIHRAAPSPRALADRLGLEAGRGSTDSRVRVRCPWHAERNPSCSIASKDGRIVAHCFACGEGGDIFAIVAAVEGLSVKRDFPEVAHRTAELLGVRVDDDRRQHRRVERDPAIELAQAVDAAADDWLAGRAIRPADAAVIEGATPATLAEAFGILHTKDEIEAERDAELERLADEYDARFYDWLAERLADEHAPATYEAAS